MIGWRMMGNWDSLRGMRGNWTSSECDDGKQGKSGEDEEELDLLMGDDGELGQYW